MKKLTIVVPVYNTERYVRKCISSIIEQENNRFSEIQLIIVNDGTKDKSIEQIQDIISAHQNIVIINQENEGLSMARNNGIKAANGEYVWCIDSDDWIQSNALEILLPLLDGKTDLLKMYSIVHNDSSDEYASLPFKDIYSFSGKDTYRNNTAQIATSVLLVYRKRFLEENNIWFMPGVFHEDNEFCPRACYLSERTTIVPYHLYVVRRTTLDGRNSITSSVNAKRSYDILRCMASLSAFNRNTVIERDIQHRINEWIGQGITIAIEVVIQNGKEEVRKFNKLYYKQYSDLTKNIWDGKVKNKVEAILFRLFPCHVVQCYKFLNLFNPRRRRG